MAWNVWESEVFRAEQLDGRALEQRVVLFADIAGVLCASARRVQKNAKADLSPHGRYREHSTISMTLQAQQITHRSRADDADVVRMWLQCVQRDV